MNKPSFNPTLEGLQAVSVMNFMSVRMYKLTSGDYIVCDLLTEKAIICLGWEHAHWVFDGCVNSVKRMVGIGMETNKYN